MGTVLIIKNLLKKVKKKVARIFIFWPNLYIILKQK